MDVAATEDTPAPAVAAPRPLAELVPQPLPPAQRRRVVVGLSGGVDSALSAWLLRQQGHEVLGIFMKNWEDDDGDGHCSSNEDFVDAAAVADVIGIEIEHVNFAAEYRERVFAEFLREYAAGRTPNPDVLCNAEIKFRAFLDHALARGAERIATGHYARVRQVADGTVQLLRGLDETKDQSYFLHRLTQAQLARTWFPVGHLRKTEVRALAAHVGLPNARKKDSTGICFIGERPFREFLGRYLHQQPGAIEDEHGRVVGRHQGLSFHTLGQRQGLGIGGVRGGVRGGDAGGTAPGEAGKLGQGLHAPWFVAAKDLRRNVLVAVQGHDHPALLSRTLRAADCAWIAGHPPAAGRCSAKTRYRQQDAGCRFEPDPRPDAEFEFDVDSPPGPGRPGGGFVLHFDAPQWAVTPGQSAVLYDGEVCLGGGVITGSDAPPAQPPGLARAPVAHVRRHRRDTP
jgi:tRNA-specific 2-thiouridylase